MNAEVINIKADQQAVWRKGVVATHYKMKVPRKYILKIRLLVRFGFDYPLFPQFKWALSSQHGFECAGNKSLQFAYLVGL